MSKGLEVDNNGAVAKAMALLLHKDRTYKELYEKLLKAGFSEDESKNAMKYVESYGYIDDERYASQYILYHKSHRSKKELIYKLKKKGISDQDLESAFADYTYQDELEAARKQFEKKLNGKIYEELQQKDKEKVIAFMVRKGFSYSLVKEIINEPYE